MHAGHPGGAEFGHWQAHNLGIGRLILETNALMIMQAMSSDAFDALAEGALLEELKFLVRENILEFECNFLSRVGNRAAHALPTLGYDCVEGEELITSSVPMMFMQLFLTICQTSNEIAKL